MLPAEEHGGALPFWKLHEGAHHAGFDVLLFDGLVGCGDPLASTREIVFTPWRFDEPRRHAVMPEHIEGTMPSGAKQVEPQCSPYFERFPSCEQGDEDVLDNVVGGVGRMK